MNKNRYEVKRLTPKMAALSEPAQSPMLGSERKRLMAKWV
jgi:hypothetical protein